MGYIAVLLCASVLLVQSIAGQSCGRISIPQPSCGGSIAVANNGGSLIVTSVGPISPNGIAVESDLSLDGDLYVEGSLPFLAAVEFEDVFPTKGSGSVNYGCGSPSQVGITSVSSGGSLNSCRGGY